jgi:hypothetical protein
LVAQSPPLQPAAQLHVYTFTPSKQVAPFWQGFDTQSLMLLPQSLLFQPGLQWHVYELTPSTQAPLPLQVTVTQSLMLIPHVSPLQPAVQEHVKEAMLSTQLAPFWQGVDWHSSIFMQVPLAPLPV